MENREEGQAPVPADVGRHTPGPWHYHQAHEEEAFAVYATEYSEPTVPSPIATVYTQSDASLIAAAPDLLGALQSLAFAADHMAAVWSNTTADEAINRAFEAIRKATGEA
jgi:hypothetical protein